MTSGGAAEENPKTKVATSVRLGEPSGKPVTQEFVKSIHTSRLVGTDPFLGKSCRRFVRKYYSGAMVEGATALPFRIIRMPTVIIQIASGKLEAKASGPKPAGL